MRILFFIAATFLTSQICFAQNSRDQKIKKEKRYLSVGAGLNANSYFGDLHSLEFENIFRTRRYRPGISLFAEKMISPRVALSAAISWNRIAADDYHNADPDQDIFNYTRNLSFRNDIFELAAIMKYHFKKNEYTYVERPFFSPYIFMGAGIFYNNPKARIPEFTQDGVRIPDSGKWQALRELGTEGQLSDAYQISTYSLFQPVVPLGLGAQWKVNNNFNINLEICFRYIFTDYLDDVGGNYVDLGALDSDLAKVFSDRSQEINSSNGRNPRDFSMISRYTQKKDYRSGYDGLRYEVYEGFGEEGRPRGDDKKADFYVTAGIRLTYILSGKKEKAHNDF